jgi:hypothetical protein
LTQIAAAVRNARKHERSLHIEQRELALLQQQREQLARKEQLLGAHRASLLGDLNAEQQRVRTLQAADEVESAGEGDIDSDGGSDSDCAVASKKRC